MKVLLKKNMEKTLFVYAMVVAGRSDASGTLSRCKLLILSVYSHVTAMNPALSDYVVALQTCIDGKRKSN